MDKVQILFPLPVLVRLRQLAQREDRTLSEIIRGAVDRYLEMYPLHPSRRGKSRKFPSAKLGKILVDASELRERAYDDE